MLAGCSRHGAPQTLPVDEAATARIPSNANRWNISTGVLDLSRRAYLGNGYVGIRVGALGGTENGTGPLPCLVAGVYHSDSLVSLPSPLMYRLRLGSDTLSFASHLSRYQQTLQMRDGAMVTSFTWSVQGKDIPLRITTFVSRNDPHLLVLHIHAPAIPGLTASHQLTAVPDKAAAPTTANPTGSASLIISAAGGGPAVGMTARDILTSAGTFEWTAYTAVYTSDDTAQPAKVAAAHLAKLAKDSYDFRFGDSRATWRSLWKADISIDGDPVAQQMIHAALFYLLCSTRAGGRWSIPPMGLSNDNWGGHIFWDAPLWMFPALVLQHPDEARPMVEYAVRMLPAARKLAAAEGKPGASYPWECARSGAESAIPPYNQERHVTADVALMVWQYYQVTADQAWLQKEGYPVLQATAQYWTSRVTPGSDGRLHIRGVIGPNETAGVVDDDAFTNGAVRKNLLAAAAAARALGTKPPSEWETDAAAIAIPTDPKLGLPVPYSGYRGEKMKQADPELLIYPLGIVQDFSLIRRMLDYYPSRISAGGPAMTDAIYATIEARQGRADRALDFFTGSYAPFLVPAFDQISEKHSRIRQYCFVTGLGGLVQTALYGFAGLKPEGNILGLQSHLPKGWKKLDVTGIHYRGKLYSLAASTTGSALVPSAG